MNASVPNLSVTNASNVTLSNLLTTAQSSPNLTTPNTINVALIDDESVPIEESRSLSEIPLSDQQQKATDETSDDEDMDDDEHCQLKHIKSSKQPIQSSSNRNGRWMNERDEHVPNDDVVCLDDDDDDEDDDDDDDDDDEPDEDEHEHDEVRHRLNH
jgi:hypothetical protein